MSNISTWSPVAADNNKAGPPDFFPEGQTPASLNDSCRELQAAVRRYYENPEFRDLGHSPTQLSSTEFTVPSDLTAVYHANRRLQITDATTLYATVVSSSFSSSTTTVTIDLDSGSLSSSLSAVSVGPRADIQSVVTTGGIREISADVTLTVADNSKTLIVTGETEVTIPLIANFSVEILNVGTDIVTLAGGISAPVYPGMSLRVFRAGAGYQTNMQRGGSYLLSDTTLTAASSNIAIDIPAGFEVHKLYVDNIRPSSNGELPHFRLDFGSGVDFGRNYTMIRSTDNVKYEANQWHVDYGQRNQQFDVGAQLEITMRNFTTSDPSTIEFRGVYAGETGSIQDLRIHSWGVHSNPSIVDSIRMLYAGRTIQSGSRFRLVGMKL